MPRTAVGRLRGGATVAVAVALTGCSAPDGVPVPSPDTAPVQVVEAYVAALNAQYRDTLAQLTEDGKVPESWLGTRVDLVEIDEPYPDAGVGTRHADDQTVGVSVRAVFHGGDGTIPDDEPIVWTYLLVEQDGRWVVYDQGQG